MRNLGFYHSWNHFSKKKEKPEKRKKKAVQAGG